MEVHNPAGPGEIVREECLKPLGLIVTAAAEALGITRKALSDLLNGHTGVSPDMAIRLEKVFAARPIPGCRCRCSEIYRKLASADKVTVNRRFATTALC
jgi:addiction module HigA family antidote